MERADTLVIDKTGTLTEGRPAVVEIVAFGMSQDELLRLAAGVEQQSEHPLAAAIVAAGALYPAFGILLSPIIAATAMALSSVSVIANALRLKTIELKE